MANATAGTISQPRGYTDIPVCWFDGSPLHDEYVNDCDVEYPPLR